MRLAFAVIKRLEDVHDALYADAVGVLAKHKPCGHKMTAGAHSCIGMVEGTRDNVPGCCCSGCPHLSLAKGCTAEKPLTCRTWLCDIANFRNPEASRELHALSNTSAALGFWVLRGDKWQEIAKAAGYYGVKPADVEKYRLATSV